MPLVRGAIEHYLELLTGKHLASTREILEEATERHDLTHRGRPLCSVLRPHMVDEATYAAACDAALAVTRALHHVVERIVFDRAYARAAGIPEHMDAVLDLDRDMGRPSMFGRIDGMLDATGTIRFIEFNSEPGYVLDDREVDRIFSTMPIATEFAQRHPFRTIPLLERTFDTLLGESRRQGRRGPPCIGVVRTTADVTAGRNFAWLADAAANGATVLIAPPEEFVYRRNQLLVDKRKVDILLLDAETMLLRPPSAKDLLAAVAEGDVRTLYGVSRGVVSSAKLVFELLSDPEHWTGVDHAATAALEKHVPWTRRLRECTTTYDGGTIDLLSYVSDHRESFVIKPSGGFGGEGVLAGWASTDEEWQRKLKTSLVRPHVVQQRVEAPEELYPVWENGQCVLKTFFSDFDPYVWDGESAGGYMVRLGTGAVLNVASGGGSLAPKWIL